jgi:hypothetical protein
MLTTLYGETMQKWNALKEMVDGIQLTEETDIVKWKISMYRKFRVKDLYLQLRAEGSFPGNFFRRSRSL